MVKNRIMNISSSRRQKESRVEDNGMRFKAKCWSGSGVPATPCSSRLGEEGLKSCLAERDVAVLADS